MCATFKEVTFKRSNLYYRKVNDTYGFTLSLDFRKLWALGDCNSASLLKKKISLFKGPWFNFKPVTRMKPVYTPFLYPLFTG